MPHLEQSNLEVLTLSLQKIAQQAKSVAVGIQQVGIHLTLPAALRVN